MRKRTTWSAIGIVALTLAAAPAGADDPRQDDVLFSINVQDFSYPERSAMTVLRILAIHEQYGIPVDFYLTGPIAAAYERIAPDLLERLRESRVASVNYHVRPPCPYYTQYDWLGLSRMDQTTRRATIRNYETHGLNLRTGQPTLEEGGYARLGGLLGEAPICASLQSDAAVGADAQSVFVDLGLRMMAVHQSQCINLGDQRNGTWLRPEHFDLKLFHHVGEDVPTLLEDAFAQAHAASGAVAPYFVGIKMHDNDFFAEDSAWVTVYMYGRRTPPFETNLRSALLPESEQAAVWDHYEATVAYVAKEKIRIAATSVRGLLRQLQSGVAPTGSGSAPAPVSSKLYVSGTMHIESVPTNWPDCDALVAFFERATRTGMRWSIGADLGWLTGEPRAAEVIRRTEALGVQWDVHAHESADRPTCSARIALLGGHPTSVVSGFLVRELEALRQPVAAPNGTTWQAEVLWGGADLAGHGEGADLDLIGVWRPESSLEFTTHDPEGSLIDVSGGPLAPADLEALAREVQAARNAPPVLSASVMVAPRTLTLVGSVDGIDAIEALAARLAAITSVEWATIDETAQAWVEAGEVPSVQEIGDPVGSN